MVEFAIYLILVAFCAMPVGVFQYKKTLLLCARQKTPEKLPDGKFYYLVSETEYVDLVFKKFEEEPNV